MSIDRVSCKNAAIEAARAAAEQLESWRRRFTVREKGRADLVTEADFAAQQAAREVLLSRFPDHAFLGEEGNAGVLQLVPNPPPTWIVDPLDGTTNYVHDVPAYCVSLGLLVENQIEVGVIYDPRLDEMFAAARGFGATLNGQPIRPSSIADLKDALLATGFPADLVRQERQLKWWEFFARRTQSLRRTGSTAISLAYVACGRFDAYWGFDNKPWDVAAAAILIQEAGGTITAVNGGPFDSFDPACVASNGALHAAMLNSLQSEPGA
jgi:myo-inositol-1(or 4)-monophosphatase